MFSDVYYYYVYFHFSCGGSLTIFNYDRLGASQLSDLKKVKLDNEHYPNLTRRLLTINREVIRIQSEGDCCWKAWSSKRGGSFHHMTVPKLYLPFDPDPIRAIEFLDENCSRWWSYEMSNTCLSLHFEGHKRSYGT